MIPTVAAEARADAARRGAQRRARGAETIFRAHLAELGAELLEFAWLGADKPHRVRCGAGHVCTPRPRNVRAGRGICRTCAKITLEHGEAQFRARLAAAGAELLEPYRGSRYRYQVRCSVGHEITCLAGNVMAGGGPCSTCARADHAGWAAQLERGEAQFRARLAEAGAELLEPYRGTHAPHRIRCAAGHVVYPYPSSILQGGGICRQCAGRVWDVFYVVTDQLGERIKFGITSGDPRPRLSDHRTDGYGVVLRLFTDLPGRVAPEVEAAALAALKLADVRPLRGREHYGAEALGLVLDITDNYPGIHT